MSNDLDYNQRRLVGKVVGAVFSDITDSIVDTHSAVKVLAITLTMEICGLGIFFVARDKVTRALGESDTNIWIYVSAAVFAVGFLSFFAVYRLMANKWPHPGSGLNNWLVSIGGGLLNVLLFFALTTSIMR